MSDESMYLLITFLGARTSTGSAVQGFGALFADVGEEQILVSMSQYESIRLGRETQECSRNLAPSLLPCPSSARVSRGIPPFRALG